MSALYVLLVCALSVAVISADRSRFVPFGTAEGDQTCNDYQCLGIQFDYNVAGVNLSSFEIWSMGAIVCYGQSHLSAVLPAYLPDFATGSVYYGTRNDSALLGNLSGLISPTFHGVRAAVVTWENMVIEYRSDRSSTFQIVMIVDASGDSWAFFYYGTIAHDSYIAVISDTTWFANGEYARISASEVRDLLVHVSSNPPTFAPAPIPAPVPVPVIPTPVGHCGDGLVNGLEQCDGGACCNADCSLKMDANCFCGRQSFVGGEWAQNYFCSSEQANKYYQCLQGPWSSQSRMMDCPSGTSCGCGTGQECSCGGLSSPCVTEGTQQTC